MMIDSIPILYRMYLALQMLCGQCTPVALPLLLVLAQIILRAPSAAAFRGCGRLSPSAALRQRQRAAESFGVKVL